MRFIHILILVLMWAGVIFIFSYSIYRLVYMFVKKPSINELKFDGNLPTSDIEIKQSTVKVFNMIMFCFFSTFGGIIWAVSSDTVKDRLIALLVSLMFGGGLMLFSYEFIKQLSQPKIVLIINKNGLIIKDNRIISSAILDLDFIPWEETENVYFFYGGYMHKKCINLEMKSGFERANIKISLDFISRHKFVLESMQRYLAEYRKGY